MTQNYLEDCNHLLNVKERHAPSITPEYLYRMWGGTVAIEDIATAMEEVRRMM